VNECWAQENTITPKHLLVNPGDTLLLNDPVFRMESVEALNEMYNFNFYKAELAFKWLKYKKPNHPLPYFLYGLMAWWKIMPYSDVTLYDKEFYSYMDSSITYAKKLLRKNPEHPEGIFFMAAANGFKGRLLTERGHYTAATIAGKNAMEYMQKGRKLNTLGVEFLFGDGLYNYYSVWIPENYNWMRPIMRLFPKGSKEEGIKQLEKVTTEAFYTRVEAQYFLSRIYSSEESNPEKGYPMMQYLNQTFPNNSYFQRQYAQMAYRTGRWEEARQVCEDMLKKIDSYNFGYESTTGRYAAFILGHILKAFDKNDKRAEEILKRCVAFCKEGKATDSGYYFYSLSYLAQIADKQGRKADAQAFYEEALDATEKKHEVHKEAKAWLDKNAPKKKSWWKLW
jgi:tetratricopeptide (TPR) repeat protein